MATNAPNWDDSQATNPTASRRREWELGIRPQMEGKMKGQKDDALLTPAEVAALFRVDPKTVTRWAKAGKLSSIRTLGGHRRYRADEVKRFLEGTRQQEG
jgi:excisionase family DNA binding protein